MRRELWCAVVALSLPAWAGEAALKVQGQDAYHGLTIPLWVLAQTSHADLSDVQVLNARGEPLPHAWVDDAAPAGTEERQQAVPFYRAPAAASAVTASQQGGWVVDLRKVVGGLLELQLEVPSGTHGVYEFVIEASDDLQQWQTHSGSAQLLSLEHQGLTLAHSTFDLAGLRARYLRLRPQSGSPLVPLSGVQAKSVTHQQTVAPLQWSDPLPPIDCTADHCDYAVPRHLPMSHLAWELPDANTLVAVDILVQYEPSNGASATPRAHRHRLRDRLHGIRHKDVLPSSTEADKTWIFIARDMAYRLRLPEGEVRSQPMRLDAGAVHRMRLRPRGGVSQFGSQPPLVRIGAPAARLVFLAREPAPYKLTWGGNAVAAMSLAELMPTRKPDAPWPVDTAEVESVLPAAPSVAVQVPAASNATPAKVPAHTPLPASERKVWLWGALLVALAVMGGMAWSLLKPKTP